VKRNSSIAIAALAAAFAVSAPAWAQEDVLKANGCLNCHDKDKKKVGPALKDVAAKGLKADDVVAKMKEGKGHPKVAKPEADLKKATEAALATK
jgi:cytochrome c551/c552